MLIGGPPRGRAPAHVRTTTVVLSTARATRNPVSCGTTSCTRRYGPYDVGTGLAGDGWLVLDEDDAAGAHVAPPLAEVAGDPLEAVVGVEEEEVDRLAPRRDRLVAELAHEDHAAVRRAVDLAPEDRVLDIEAVAVRDERVDRVEVRVAGHRVAHEARGHPLEGADLDDGPRPGGQLAKERALGRRRLRTRLVQPEAVAHVVQDVAGAQAVGEAHARASGAQRRAKSTISSAVRRHV